MNTSHFKEAENIQRIAFWKQFLIFGLPGITIYMGVHYLVPIMVEAGIDLVFSWTLAVVGPTVINAISILCIYYYTNRPNWNEFISRFRLHKPDASIFWQVPVAAVAIVVLNELFAWTIPFFKQIPLFSPPDLIPEIFSDVYKIMKSSDNITFMGEQITPETWWLIPFWLFFWVVLAVVGEEIVWRGFLLPRQEKTYGKFAWLVNGLLWNIPFHLYTLHNLFSDMPLYLLLPFVVFKIKNTWVGIAIHALLVSLALLIIITA